MNAALHAAVGEPDARIVVRTTSAIAADCDHARRAALGERYGAACGR